MVTLHLENEDYAKIIASLNYIVDECEDKVQNVFTIEKATKGKMKDILAYQTLGNVGDEANKAWGILSTAYTREQKKIVVEV